MKLVVFEKTLLEIERVNLCTSKFHVKAHCKVESTIEAYKKPQRANLS